MRTPVAKPNLYGPCPACGADWRGAEIPAEQREFFGEHTHFSRRISIVDRDRDATRWIACPDCRNTWEV